MNKKIKFKPREWKTSIDANCYMYALNYRKRKLDDVGKISGLESKDYYDDEELIERLIKDCQVLGLDIRKSTYYEETKEGEWKIALFSTHDIEGYDFHFMREDECNRWSHKFRNKYPKKVDKSHVTIIDPREADIGNYDFVSFFILKESAIL